jgi:hypothetical protein
MNFVAELLQGIAFVPAIVQGIEALFGSKSGAEKRNAALSFVGTAISVSDAVASRQIIDQQKFQEGLGKVVDGTVECLNASVWNKSK